MNVEVTVICLVYNHEDSLRRCLDGIVMQRTGFPFDILVHDDHSTDESISIIQEYAGVYPRMIKAIFEKKNRFPEGAGFIRELFKSAEGRYIAYCEGDDYWTDKDKLQKQYDYMEAHPECSLCCHDTVVHDMAGEWEDRNFLKGDVVTRLDAEHIFDAWMIHTSSYFFRNNYDIFPEWVRVRGLWDYALSAIAYRYGTVDVLPETMSVYNFRNPQGVTVQNATCGERRRIESVRERKVFLEDFLINEESDSDVEDVIRRRIQAIKEATATDELICDIRERMEGGWDGNISKWLTDRLNNEEVYRERSCPARATENNAAASRAILLFKMIKYYYDTAGQKPTAFIQCLIRLYTTVDAGESCMRDVAVDKDNRVGWGMASS